MRLKVVKCQKNFSDALDKSYASISITDSIDSEEHYTSMQAFQQCDYQVGQWIENDSESYMYTLFTNCCCADNVYVSTGASIVQYNPNSVHNTPLCTYSSNKCDSFKVLVNTTSAEVTFTCNILQNEYFGEKVNTNSKY